MYYYVPLVLMLVRSLVLALGLALVLHLALALALVLGLALVCVNQTKLTIVNQSLHDHHDTTYSPPPLHPLPHHRHELTQHVQKNQAIVIVLSLQYRLESSHLYQGWVEEGVRERVRKGLNGGYEVG